MAYRTSAALLAAIFSVAATAGIATAQETPAAEAPAVAADAAPAAADAAAPAADAAAPTADAAAPAAGAPAAAAPGVAPEGTEPQVGQAYARDTFGDWTLRCVKTPDNKDPCELYQLLKDKDGGAVAETSVLPMSQDVAAVVTFVAPLETDLQAGLGMQIDANKAARYPFMLCAPVGCISRIGMTDAEIAALKKGKAASVSVLPFGARPEQMVSLNLSLTGFTAGYDAMIEANKDIAIPGAPSQTQGSAPAGTPAPAAAAPAN